MIRKIKDLKKFFKLKKAVCSISISILILSCLNGCGNSAGDKSVVDPGNTCLNSSIIFDGIQSITDLGASSVRVDWTPNTIASYYSVYEVTGSPVLVGLVSAPASSFTVTGLSPSTTYTYRVRAADASGTVESNVVARTITTGLIPPAVITIASILPTGDDLVGGSVININGTNFQNGAVARINSVSCATTTFVSTTLLQCTVPSSGVAAGTVVGVSVTNPDTGFQNLASSFTYILATNCMSWKTINHNTNKNYFVDHDNNSVTPRVQVTCDQTTDGGGWLAVLNYVHLGGTNPALQTLSNSFPLMTAAVLGSDESLATANWGHVNGTFLSSLPFSYIRFSCQTAAHSRLVNFKTNQATCLSYLKTGSGNCSSLGSSYTPLALHTGIGVPASINGTVSSVVSETLTNFPFYQGGVAHWGIGGLGNRWECDDYANGPANNTIHRAWVR